MNAEDLANTAWVFAKAGWLDAQLFTVFAKVAKQRVGSMDAEDLGNTAWAFAKAG